MKLLFRYCNERAEGFDFAITPYVFARYSKGIEYGRLWTLGFAWGWYSYSVHLVTNPARGVKIFKSWTANRT